MNNSDLERKNPFDMNMWKNWVEQSPSFFSGLLDKSVIGILIGENEDQIILLEKKNHDMLVKIENPDYMERPVADIIFKIKENTINEVWDDKSFIKFIQLLSNQKIKVYTLRSQSELICRGYIGFFGRLGLNLGGKNCC